MVAMEMQTSIFGSQGLCLVAILPCKFSYCLGGLSLCFQAWFSSMVCHTSPGFYLFTGLLYLEELWELLVVKAVCQKREDLQM